MKKLWVFIICGLSLLTHPERSSAQPVGTVSIDWEVANRFRLFADQKEFDRQVEAMKAGGGSVLGAEDWLMAKYGGRGWADTVGALCFDTFRGRVLETCKRDGVNETYLNPPSIRIKLQAKLPADFGEATCDWTIGRVNIARTIPGKNCKDPIEDARASTYQQTPITVVARNQAGATLQGRIDVQVRDVLIVGMGDSIAAGEGNPIHPVRLDDQGFCFRRALIGTTQTFALPGRAGLNIVKSCDESDSSPETRELWDSKAAGWLFSGCHLSLYSYQLRTALALAVQNRQISVTFVPLGCTGAEIGDGLLYSMPARERPTRNGVKAPRYVEAQVSQLRNYLRSITDRRGRRRPIDLMLLTVGANDMGFSGLVASIIVDDPLERRLLKSTLVTIDDAKENLKELRDDFVQLRRQLRPLMGNRMDRVLFTTYGDPGTSSQGVPCPQSRVGFDAHPAFSVNAETLRKTVKFVDEDFLPTLRGYVTCGPNGGCARPETDAMKYADGRLAQFAAHGFCASGAQDPEFDKQCFKDGHSFTTGADSLEKPMACDLLAPHFKAYAKRARWVRTANDSYMSAMTYPANTGFLGNPIDLHDARWGLTSVVYGGAIHPTSEGHAAMADAALGEAREVLGLPPPAVGTAAQ